MDKNRFLIKLKRYSINEIIKFSTFYSLYSASTNYSFDINLKPEIFTWEIDSLLLMKLYVGQTSGNVSSLTQDKFVELINYIKNRDFSEEFLIQGRDILDFLPIVAANQFTNQIENRILMYRSIYFFRLSSNDLLRVAFESRSEERRVGKECR